MSSNSISLKLKGPTEIANRMESLAIKSRTFDSDYNTYSVRVKTIARYVLFSVGYTSSGAVFGGAVFGAACALGGHLIAGPIGAAKGASIGVKIGMGVGGGLGLCKGLFQAAAKSDKLFADWKKKQTSTQLKEYQDFLDMQTVSQEVVCPISHSIMENPCIISCGHVFDYASIQQWLKGHQGHCPVNGCKNVVKTDDEIKPHYRTMVKLININKSLIETVQKLVEEARRQYIEQGKGEAYVNILRGIQLNRDSLQMNLDACYEAEISIYNAQLKAKRISSEEHRQRVRHLANDMEMTDFVGEQISKDSNLSSVSASSSQSQSYRSISSSSPSVSEATLSASESPCSSSILSSSSSSSTLSRRVTTTVSTTRPSSSYPTPSIKKQSCFSYLLGLLFFWRS